MAKNKAVVAKALRALAKTNGPSFVIASEEPELKQVEMAAFKCNACNVPFRAVAGTQPFCVTCGSEDVIDEEIPAEDDFVFPETDDEMSAIQCSSCGTHNLITDKLATAFAGNLHCVTCGEDVEFMAGEGDTSENEGDEVVLEGEDDLLAVEDVAAESSEGEETEESEQSEGEDLIDDTEEEAEFEGDVDNDGDIDAEDFEAVEEESVGEESARIKLLTVAKKGELSFELSGSKLTAYIGDTPVATLQKETAGENAGVMHSTTFTQAVKHTARSMGVERALAHFGFKPLFITVPVNKFVNMKAEAKISGERAKIEEQAKTFKDDFRHCLQIASAGLNKRFFKNQDNALKAALFDELSALNIRNPAKVIDKVFAAHSDSYHSTLIALATDLLGKDANVRNQIAEAVGCANYQAAEMDEVDMLDEESEGEDVSVEETLESAGVRRKSVTASTARGDAAKTAPQFISAAAAEIRKQNGGRIF